MLQSLSSLLNAAKTEAAMATMVKHRDIMTILAAIAAPSSP